MTGKNSSRLNLVVIRSTDIDRLRDFYSALLGVEFVPEKHGDGPRHYSCQLGDVVLEIYPARDNVPSQESVGFLVPNLEEALKRVELTHIHKAPMQTDYGRLAVIRDPDGRMVHLEERTSQ